MIAASEPTLRPFAGMATRSIVAILLAIWAGRRFPQYEADLAELRCELRRREMAA